MHSTEAGYRKPRKALFRAAARKLNKACDALAQGAPRQGRGGRPGNWEMTWSFSGPDGRATWEWASIELEGRVVPVLRWRRIGGHAIFSDPLTLHVLDGV